MTFEHKPNSGSLFKNKDKKTDSYPGYKGSAKIEGVDYWLAAWLNTTKDGEKYFSIKFSAMEEKEKQTQDDDIVEDDIPF